MHPYSLRNLLKAVLLKEYDGNVHEDGLEEFSFHRLRHTNTSWLHARGVKPETSEKNHLWDRSSSRESYTEVDADQLASESRRTMPTVAALKPKPPRMTMEDFLAWRRARVSEQRSKGEPTL